MKKWVQILFLVTIASVLFPMHVLADGIIIPEPPPCPPGPCPPEPFPISQLVIRYHRVTVTIDDQVAVTRVDQVFYNPNDWQVEGTYLFPIPQDAAVSAFSLWVDDQPIQGEILDAEQARRTYEEIVRTLRDPALLEYAGTGAVQARIFPIAPGEERRVELEYTQVLTAENGLVKYIYPLSTEKFSSQALESVSIQVNIRAQSPIRAVYSPTHSLEVIRQGETSVKAGYEETDVLPDQDFGLYYSIGEAEAFHLLSYRDPSDPLDADGFFLVMLAPRPANEASAFPKDVIFVLDKSGSMEGEKFTQAQEALRYVLQNLNEDDRFNIISFSTGIETYARDLRPAGEAREALPWVDRLSALGNTDINRALLEAAALVQPERPTYLIFLTDGLPTEGVTESQEILNNFRLSAPKNLRLFAFGVGYDVDTFLLDSLTQENRGASTYVLPGERLDETLSSFYARINTPVLANLELDFGALPVYDLYPQPLPDLFVGSQIVAVGRYREGGVTDVTLSGDFNNERLTFTYPEQVLSPDSRSSNKTLAALPRLWATRKIGYLLNQIRLNGPDQETINQIVKLSIRYGIVTPYTSYLVTEEAALGVEAQERIAEDEFRQLQSAPAAEVFGQDAVRKAVDQGNMAGAESVQVLQADTAERVKITGSRTFVFQDGLWIDTGYDPAWMQPVPVAFLSEDYFKLAQAYPELGAAFALGSRVIALADGQVYEVVAEEENVQPIQIAPTRTQPPVLQIPQVDTTPTPVSQAFVSTPEQNNPTPPDAPVPAQPAAGPCLAGLLPLGMALFGGIGVFARRKG